MRRYDNGLERCIGCALCAAACPADAIYVEAAENTDAERYSPGERYAKTYEINMLRCIFCGYCEDACPTDAIVLTDKYELSTYDRRRDDLHQRSTDRTAAARQAGHAADKCQRDRIRSILPDGLVSNRSRVKRNT